jgi:hypothetical protein
MLILLIRVFIVGFNSITKFQYALFFNKILQYPQRFIRKHRILKFLNVQHVSTAKTKEQKLGQHELKS